MASKARSENMALEKRLAALEAGTTTGETPGPASARKPRKPRAAATRKK
jgi:BMFP domain-containing protein YqiC